MTREDNRTRGIKHPSAAMKRVLRDALDVTGLLPYAGLTRHPGQWRSIHQNAGDDRRLFSHMASTLTVSSVCVDIGANRGTHLRRMVRSAPQGRHIAVEPITFLADDLAKRYPSVDVIRAVVGEREGYCDFWVVPDRTAISGIGSSRFHGAERVELPMTTLDVLLRGRDDVHFVKIDTEGEELSVMRGGESALARHRPTIAFECGPGFLAQHTVVDLAEMFARFQSLDLLVRDTAGSVQSEQSFIDAVCAGRCWNWMAERRS